jgi:hypothetical protein
MNLIEFRSLLDRPSWSKDVAVWIGNGAALSELLQNMNKQDLDLLELFPDDEALPVTRDDRAELLGHRLDQTLQAIRPAGPERMVLRVRNVALLARYGVGLQSFFDWFGGSKTFVVLEINRVKAVALPESIMGSIGFDADWLVEYFRPLLAKPDNVCVEVE